MIFRNQEASNVWPWSIERIPIPRLWQVCRPYFTNRAGFLTDGDVLKHYGPAGLETVLANESAWNAKWAGKDPIEAMKQNASE